MSCEEYLFLALDTVKSGRKSPKFRRKCCPFFTSRLETAVSSETSVSFYQGADKSLARPTSRCILFDGENISFDASLVLYIYIYSANIPPIMIINRIYEHQNLLSL